MSMGIVMSRVKEPLMREQVSKFNRNAYTMVPLELVGALADRMKKTPTKELITCGECSGPSPVELDKCPYCGAADAEEDHNSSKAAPPAKDARTEMPKETRMETTKEITKVTNGAHAPARPAQVALTEATNKKLDHAVDKFHKLKADGAEWFWHTGKHVYDAIYEPNLWLARAEGGKPRYKKFDEFAEQELGVTSNFCYRMMEVARNYTLDECRKYGTSNLRMLLTVPKELRGEIVERIQKGELKTHDDVKAAAKETKAKHGVVGSTKGAGKSGRGVHGAGKNQGGRPKSLAGLVKEHPQQTVILKSAKTTMKFMSSDKDGRPAKSLKDRPFAEVESVNGVRLRFKLFEGPGGQLAMTLEMRREE